MKGQAFIDATRPLSPGLPRWPGDPPLQITCQRTPISLDCCCVTSTLSLGLHTGTHVDAPSHLMPVEGDALRWDLSQIPLPVLVGEARVVDLRGRMRIEAADIRDLPPGPPRLLLRTQDPQAAYSMQHFTALSEDAAEALVSRACQLVGIDAPSVDPPDSPDLPAHRVLLDAGLVIVEGLDLSKAEPGDYQLICLPLRLLGVEAAPARVLLSPIY